LEGEKSGSVNHQQVEKSAEVLELARGIEPPTCGLQNHCSAIELRQHCSKFPIVSLSLQAGSAGDFSIAHLQDNGWLEPTQLLVSCGELV
jgi:hypothetical protein